MWAAGRTCMLDSCANTPIAETQCKPIFTGDCSVQAKNRQYFVSSGAEDKETHISVSRNQKTSNMKLLLVSPRTDLLFKFSWTWSVGLHHRTHPTISLQSDVLFLYFCTWRVTSASELNFMLVLKTIDFWYFSYVTHSTYLNGRNTIMFHV